ncbi:hypothetical protein [Streptomyces sp. NPDC018610]|jgi:hypothetical protein|uniref:hypothetical protein n=1 Tax=Streptomyces sp. NPDC018610 TaxID=3365049 RepID=UPI0037907C3D
MRIAGARRRVSTSALTALMACAGAMVAAAPAMAGDGSTIFGQDNTVAIGAVTMVSPLTLSVDVTYSCEPKDTPHLGVVWRLADDRDSDIYAPRGLASPVAVTCDRQKHNIKVNASAWDESWGLTKGDPVSVTAMVSNYEGVPYAQLNKVVTV